MRTVSRRFSSAYSGMPAATRPMMGISTMFSSSDFFFGWPKSMSFGRSARDFMSSRVR